LLTRKESATGGKRNRGRREKRPPIKRRRKNGLLFPDTERYKEEVCSNLQDSGGWGKDIRDSGSARKMLIIMEEVRQTVTRKRGSHLNHWETGSGREMRSRVESRHFPAVLEEGDFVRKKDPSNASHRGGTG